MLRPPKTPTRHGTSYSPQLRNISSHEAPSALRSFNSIGSAGQYSPASMLWVYRTLMPTFSARASCVRSFSLRSLRTFLPNLFRAGHGVGFCEGTSTCWQRSSISNTRLYLVRFIALKTSLTQKFFN